MRIKSLVILIISLFVFCACSPYSDPVIPGPNNDGSNPSYDRVPDDGENDEEPSEEITDYAIIKAWDSVNKPTYYKSIDIKASRYKNKNSKEIFPCYFIFCHSAFEKPFLPTPQRGQIKSSGRSSNLVPGAIPHSSQPSSSSYSQPQASHTYFIIFPP